MAKQVNASYDCVSNSITYWTTEWSVDGYIGRLTDTIYENGVSWTDWCLFVGTEEECAQFIAICEKESEEAAFAWAREEAHKAFVAKYGELPKL
jgi:hypothetical protein